jgi:ATP-dependent exoDNAse (exonuclease V) beta subunit
VSEPSDAVARNDIATALDDNLFVEAGAGTGKTHELVGRIVNLVAAGADVRRIAAITFTEAAAAELRERVRERLAATAADIDLDSTRAERCATALAALDDAAIGTLHAFAQRILSEFPVEAGLPPGFDVLDEIESEIAFFERWTRWCDRMYTDASLARAITAASVLRIGTRQLANVARELNASWDLARGWEPTAEPVPDFDATDVLARIDEATVLASHCCVESDTLLRRLAEVAAVAHEVRGALDHLEAFELLADVPLGGSKNRGRKEAWRGAKDEVLGRLADAEAARVAAVDAVRTPAVRTLLGSVTRFVRVSADERRAEGRVEFHDLLVLAVDLLRDRPDVRARLHERYEYLLLDEFQDTDPLQIEIAVLVTATDDDAGTKPWWDCAVAPGRLFVVGDPKQSIYRYRRADIELFRRVRVVLGDAVDARRSLTTSFRSRPKILDFVNEVFAPLMLYDDPLQAPYAVLTADRGRCAATPEPVRTFGAAAPRDTDLDQLRRTEARELAGIVRRVRDEGWQVDDGFGAGGTRDARFADIAILLPTRATLPYLEEALEEADVPTRIESQSLVFATTEVQELLQVLQAIDDPVNDVAIVAALRSPGFACRDDDLVEFARADGTSWDYRVDPPQSLAPEQPVVAGMRALLELHERRWWDGVSELVERVIRGRRLLELAVERRRPRDHWRRLRFVADAARAYADRGGTSLRGFVEWAVGQAAEEARAVEVIVPEPDDDAVRVLTVHGAKGLEFPVVILTGLGLREQPRTGSVLFGESGPEVRVGSSDLAYLSDGFDHLREHEHEAWRAEQIRLLYVAATRARDHLVVSLHRREGDKCLAAHLADAATSRPELTGAAGPRTIRESVPPEDTGVAFDRDGWISARLAHIERARREPVVAATTLAQRAADDVDAGLAKAETDAADTPPWRRGRAGTAIGRTVHAVLQTVDLATGDGLDATARAQALAEGIPSREHEIRALVESVLRSATVQGASAPGVRCWREVPIAARVDGVLVEGFIDLLVEHGDGFTVVDYKTDQVSAEPDVARAVTRYTPQGAAYALALGVLLGRPVTRCVFVFARPDGAIEQEIADLAGAVGSVRGQVRALAPAGSTP